MTNNSINKIPAPVIKFDSKAALKRKTPVSRFIFAAGAAAAVVAIGVGVLAYNPQVDTVITVPSSVAIDTVAVASVVEYIEPTPEPKAKKVRTTPAKQPNVEPAAQVVPATETPPPITKIEFRHQIAQTTIAEPQMGLVATNVELEIEPAKVERTLEIQNPNLRNIANAFKSSNSNLKALFRPTSNDESNTNLKQLFSKNN